MKLRRAVVLGLAALGGAFAGSFPAHAEPTPADKALATALFKEGRALVAAGEIHEACRKFEESQRLDPAGGTLLNLAVCHEKEGRTATAWAELVDALGVARREGREDRIKLAQEHIAALERSLPRMMVIVPAMADLPALQIRRDGGLIGRGAWATAMPVDPGEHVIEATAPGRRTFRKRVTVHPGVVQAVTIEPLEDLAPRRTPRLGLRTAGFVAGGVGLLWLGVGAFQGLRAFSKRSRSDELCPGGRCSVNGVKLNDEAKLAADLSTASFAAGAIGVGLGATLLVLGHGHDDPSQRDAARVHVWLGSSGAAVSLLSPF
ncbi:Hypothetical protein A7982_01926 [Minicystis rosea]|nr:Hypothetical protein A7982_01926 [Minicystis rosea]